MATIHPSRMGLVPHNGSSRAQPERWGRSRSRDRDDTRRGGYSERRDNGYGRRENGHERRDNGWDRRDDGQERRGRDNDDQSRNQDRRASPSYDDYHRPPPHLAHSPRPPPGNTYPSRGGGYGGGRPPGGMGNSDWFESRRAQREGMTVDVWPPSPKAPSRSLSPKRKRSSKKHKRTRSPSTDLTDSSEDERRRRKEKRRAKKERRRDEKDRERKKSHLSRSRSPGRDRERGKDYSSDEEERRPRRDRSRSKGKAQDRRSRSRSARVESVARSPSRSPSPMSDQRQTSHTPAPDAVSALVKGKGKANASDSEEEVGPRPVFQATATKRLNERDYGGALLRGEGTAMAAFLQDDPNMRIPRRGEIGLTSDQIARYEDSGYVMSGSRHKRMNAVRMRKENQVISAEEKRGILKLQKEERERREAILREEFNEIVNEKLKAANVNVDLASTERRSPSP